MLFSFQNRKCIHDVDIVKSLKEIAEKNTVFHKADFLIDKQILKKAAEST